MSKAARKAAATPSRPLQFRDFAECAHWLRHGVFAIVRGRETSPNNTQWLARGTGFLSNKGRMVTAAHIFKDPNNPHPLGQHQDSDNYYLLRNDHEGEGFAFVFKLTLNQTLFLDQPTDTAVIYLPDNFYGAGGVVHNRSSSFFRVATHRLSIGTDVGVFGYPLIQLEFENRDVTKPKIGDVILRVDRGVINAGFDIPNVGRIYEFTMSFNPGNSGGPIVDIRTGRFISIVKGYRPVTIDVVEKDVPQGLQVKAYSEKSYLEPRTATYSQGVGTVSTAAFLAQHGIVP